MVTPAGQPFTATLVDPGGDLPAGLRFGARIETPVNRAIVGAWTEATLEDTLWTAELEAPPKQPLSPYGMWVTPWIQSALDEGEFLVVWMDDGPVPVAEYFVPLFTAEGAAMSSLPAGDWPPVDQGAVTPSVDDVAALEGTRRVDDTTAEQPTFTADTRPTDVEVEALIDQAVPVVLSQLRPSFPASYYPQVSHAIALYAAILVEGSYYREQINVGAVALYRQLLQQSLTGIAASIELELNSAAAAGGRLH